MAGKSALELLTDKVHGLDDRLRKQEQLTSWMLGVAVGGGAILGFFAQAIKSALNMGG